MSAENYGRTGDYVHPFLGWSPAGNEYITGDMRLKRIVKTGENSFSTVPTQTTIGEAMAWGTEVAREQRTRIEAAKTEALREATEYARLGQEEAAREAAVAAAIGASTVAAETPGYDFAAGAAELEQPVPMPAGQQAA